MRRIVALIGVAVALCSCGGSVRRAPPAIASAPAGEIVVDLTNFAFVPESLAVTPDATVTLRNRTGSTPHTFTIEQAGIDVTVTASSTQTIALALAPGTYRLICRFHGGQGMAGTIEV